MLWLIFADVCGIFAIVECLRELCSAFLRGALSLVGSSGIRSHPDPLL